MRARLRRLVFGLSTALGLMPRGFFIPYRHAGAVEPAGYPALKPLFHLAEPEFEATLQAIEAVAADLLAIAAGRGTARFTQDWFPRLDAAAAYALVRMTSPRRIIEIGCGHSTRFLAQAVRDGGLSTEIACIDPAPRATISALGVRHDRHLLQKAEAPPVAELGAGDILFVDSSHVAMPGTDVDRFFLDLLPRLKTGVLVHVHDVFLPDPYPSTWAWRAYNEQLLVGVLLQGRAYDLVFASHYVANRRRDLIEGGVVARLPHARGPETSLWLRKR